MDRLPGEVHNSVLFGLDGFMFLHGGRQQQMAHLTGECEPSEESIANFSENMTKRKEFCNSRGIEYLHIVFPSKPVVYKDKIDPSLQERVKSLFIRFYEKSLDSCVKDYVLYPYAELIESNCKDPVFRRLDTHNTDAGYMVVVKSILDRLNYIYNQEEFFYRREVSRTGDLAKMLGFQKKEDEKAVFPYLPPIIVENTHTLKGNTHHICIVHNPVAISDRRLLVFGDSFIHGALTYLSPCFKDIIYVRSESFQEDMVELCGPDVVISSNAERYLREVNSDKTSTPMLFANYGIDSYKPKEEFINAYKSQFSWKYHREQYDEWKENLSGSYFYFGGLGVCKLNDQIKVIGKDSCSFASLGNDPHFITYCKEIKPGKKYILEFEIESNVVSTAAVYFTEKDNRSFSNERKVTANIDIGNNQISFKLECQCLHRYIRIDPLSDVGNFSLSKITFTEIL